MERKRGELRRRDRGKRGKRQQEKQRQNRQSREKARGIELREIEKREWDK